MKRSELERKFLNEDRDARLEFIRAAMGTREGRIFFWWLLSIGKYGVNPFSHDALAMAFGCGEQNVGQQILGEMLVAVPTSFPDMMLEQYQLQELRDVKLAQMKEEPSDE